MQDISPAHGNPGLRSAGDRLIEQEESGRAHRHEGTAVAVPCVQVPHIDRTVNLQNPDARAVIKVPKPLRNKKGIREAENGVVSLTFCPQDGNRSRSLSDTAEFKVH